MSVAQEGGERTTKAMRWARRAAGADSPRDRTETEGGRGARCRDSQDLKSLRAAEAQCEDLEVPLDECGGYGGERSCRGRQKQ